MTSTKREANNKAMKERVEKILKHEIKTQTDFMNKYNETYCSNIDTKDGTEISRIKDQSHVNRIFDKFHVEKRGGVYQIINNPTFNEVLLKQAVKLIENPVILDKTTLCILPLKHSEKKEFICEAIERKFKPKKTALIPAYGSVVIIGDSAEVKKITAEISELKTLISK